MARNNPATWGLKIPGRPPTPSEGYAQQYDRIGPVETQKLWTFDNGTCLTYGPDDLVDEFDPVLHPFCNQIALIDTMIRETRVVRGRYEGATRRRVDNGASPFGSESTAVEEDPFNDFRTVLLDPQTLPTVTLESGTYLQTPSRYATVGDLVSVYSSINKSDMPGEAHRGMTSDTRFGMCGKPSFGTLQQHIQRQDNIHRLGVQMQPQEGSTGRRRGRRARQSENDRQHVQLVHGQNRDQQNHTLRGRPNELARGNVNNRFQTTMNHRHQVFQHERFRSQEFSIAGTPFTAFAIPAFNGQTFRPQDYEDEGPLLHNPFAHDYYEQVLQCQSFMQQDQSIPGEFNQYEPAELAAEGLAPAQMSRAYSVHRAFAENSSANGSQDFSTLGAFAHAGHARRASQGAPSRPSSVGPHCGGHIQISSSGDRSQPAVQQDSAAHQAVLAPSTPVTQWGQPVNLHERRRVRHEQQQFEEEEEEEEEEMSTEYARFLDDMNMHSRIAGAEELEGDKINSELNNEPAISLQPPTPASTLLQRRGFGPMLPLQVQPEVRVEWESVRNRVESSQPGAINGNRSLIIESLRAATFGTRQGMFVSTRPPSPLNDESGRLSEPPRSRPVLLSPIHFEPAPVRAGRVDNMIFGERAGSVSREPSPVGRAARMHGRRLFE